MRWVIIQVIFSVQGGNAMKAKVYFSREITPEKVVALYRAVGRELPGKVAVTNSTATLSPILRNLQLL